MTLELSREPLPGTAPVPGLGAAVQAAIDNLLRRQLPDGHWMGELISNASITAEYVLLCRYLGVVDPVREAASVRYLLGESGPDGSYSMAPGLPGDVSITTEVLVALRAAGLSLEHPAVAAARAFVAEHGGVHATRMFTRMWLALGGLWPWAQLPAVPPEWLLAPATLPGSVYDLASWARATTVPLTILRTMEVVFPLAVPAADELPLGDPAPSAGSVGWRLVERAARLYGRLPALPPRRLALGRAERWILDHQEADGSWAGIQPPWVYGLMALRARGLSLDHPAMARGMAALESFGIEDERGFRLQACISPVWDTALAVWALADAGLGADHPAIQRAVEWLLDREVQRKGDWAVRRPGIEPGGWPFELYNDQYPDTDDTAVVLCALTAAGHRRHDPGRIGAAMERALTWLLAMQGSDGGYGAFDVDNQRHWVEKLPISDFGEVLDRPSPDVTAHVIEAFVRCGGSDLAPARRRALAWLRRSEEGSGAYYGRWGVNYVYGDAAVATALAANGDLADAERLLRIGRWVESHSGPDGGFGESVLSYHDPNHIGRGDPTPSQTSWALLSLLAAHRGAAAVDPDGGLLAAAHRAARHLLGRQLEDGSWTDQLFTGTGFPRAFYLGYQMYATVFPLMALARLREPVRELGAGW